jgi:hypothetical protein
VIYITPVGLKGPYHNGGMLGQSDQSLRIVIQFVAGSVGSPSQYRLIAYSGARTFPALTFPSAAALLQRLEAASIPPDHRPQLAGPEPDETRIVYSTDVALDAAQMRLLGLV